jgi:hypothetical protein
MGTDELRWETKTVSPLNSQMGETDNDKELIERQNLDVPRSLQKSFWRD